MFVGMHGLLAGKCNARNARACAQKSDRGLVYLVIIDTQTTDLSSLFSGDAMLALPPVDLCKCALSDIDGRRQCAMSNLISINICFHSGAMWALPKIQR